MPGMLPRPSTAQRESAILGPLNGGERKLSQRSSSVFLSWQHNTPKNSLVNIPHHSFVDDVSMM